MDLTFWIFFIIGYLGWGITLYAYSKKFKSIIDSNAQKAKSKLDNIVDKAQSDNRNDNT